MSKFYTQDQNNSGGHFYVNDDVSHYVIVEADSESQALEIFEDIVEPYSSYCECCGTRWSSSYWKDDIGDKPVICGEDMENYESSYYRKEAIIYYLDGTKKRYTFETKTYEVLK